MIGLLIGTACLVGLIKTARCGRRGGYGGHGGCGGYSRGGCGGGRWGGHGGWGHDSEGHEGHEHFGGPGFGGGGFSGPGRWMLRGLFQRLQTSPGQEKVILEAVETLKAQRAAVKDVFRETRADAAKGFRAEGFDETLMGNAFARQDEAITAVRKAAMDAFAKVHAALDERQRKDLADIIERGPAAWGHGGQRGWNPQWRGEGGPYRY